MATVIPRNAAITVASIEQIISNHGQPSALMHMHAFLFVQGDAQVFGASGSQQSQQSFFL
jgi:hypothetical protein